MDKSKLDKEIKAKVSRVKQGSEEKAANGYFKSAIRNQKKAAKELNKTIEGANKMFETLINSAPKEQQAQLIELVSKAKKLINQAKKEKSGDVSKIIEKLNNLK
jgi:hypothetical protein